MLSVLITHNKVVKQQNTVQFGTINHTSHDGEKYDSKGKLKGGFSLSLYFSFYFFLPTFPRFFLSPFFLSTRVVPIVLTINDIANALEAHQQLDAQQVTNGMSCYSQCGSLLQLHATAYTSCISITPLHGKHSDMASDSSSW